MAEYSFDVVSKIDRTELSNALDMAKKEVENRFYFKGSKVEIKLEKDDLLLEAADEMKMKQLIDIIQTRIVKRNISLKAFKFGKFESNVSGVVKCKVEIQNGLSTEQAKLVGKLIRDSKIKVQSRQQEDQVRVTGKAKDDLEAVQKMLRDADLDFDVTFANYR